MAIRRLILTIVLVAAIAGFIARSIPRTTMLNQNACRAALLHRPLKPLRLHQVPAIDAIRQIAQAADLKIEVDWDALAAVSVKSNKLIEFDASHLDVNGAIQTMIEDLTSEHDVIGYDFRGDSIVIGTDPTLQRFLKIYDVHDLTNEIRRWRGTRDPDYEEATQDELIHVILFCFDSRYWGYRIRHDLRESLSFLVAGRLCITETNVAHARIAEFLAGIRASRPDGSGSEISSPYVRARRSRHLTIRFYDVRDLIDHVRFTVLFRRNPYHEETLTGLSALCELIVPETPFRRRAQSFRDFRICCIGGRLVAEGAPESHARLRQFLDELRTGAGKPIEGLVVSPP